MKNPSTNAGDAGLTPEWGRSPGEGNGFPLPVYLPGKFLGGVRGGYSSWNCEELDTTEHTAPGCGQGIITPEKKVLLVAHLFLTLCDPMYYSPPRLFRPWNLPGKNTGLGCHSRLQEIELGSPASQTDSLSSEPSAKPR